MKRVLMLMMMMVVLSLAVLTKVFVFADLSHTLLDAKITNVLSLCHDQVILSSVQNIIQNMITQEDPSQQQPHYLQSVGFGGLWRFAGPFTKVSLHGDACLHL